MKNWKQVLAALACAILGALSLASCESDGVPAPNPTCQDPASCPYSLNSSDKDTVSSPDTEQEGSQPDTEQPAPPQEPTNDYTGEKCPAAGNCVLSPTEVECPDCWNRWQCGQPPNGSPPLAFTAEPTEWIPTTCNIPEPTP